MAFDALLTERSVTRAANRLGLSQPAMSNALSRLREGVGDPLFERTRHGIHPTSRALAMAEPVRSAMTSLQQALLAPAEQSAPARTLSVAANAYSQVVLLPHVARLVADAPTPMVLSVRDADASSPAAALTIDWTDTLAKSAGSRRAVVLRDAYVAVARRSKRDVGTRYALEDFLEADHVAIGAERAHDAVDSALTSLERRRQIAVYAPDFIGAACIASSTALIGVIPRRLAQLLAPSLGLRILKIPLDLKEISLSVSWPGRSADDHLAMWLKGRVLEAGKA